MLHSSFTLSVMRHLQHYLFRYHLNTACQIHLALSNARFWLARWTTKKFVEGTVRHSQPLRVAEILVVHAKAAILPDFQQLIFDLTDELRLPVRSESHYFVLAAINFESGVISEGA